MHTPKVVHVLVSLACMQVRKEAQSGEIWAGGAKSHFHEFQNKFCVHFKTRHPHSISGLKNGSLAGSNCCQGKGQATYAEENI